MKPSKENIKRVEIIIVVILISLLWFFGFDAYKKMVLNTKEAALANELKIIRQAVYVYVLKYKIYPENLKELEEKNIIDFEGKIKNQKYMKNKRVLETGVVLDPFGNPYIYDKKNGQIRSSTPKYMNE